MTALEYVRFPGGVKVTKLPDVRGYWRCRWVGPDGRRHDRRFPSWEDAEAFAWELSAAVRADRTGAARLGDRPIAELVEAWHDPSSHDRPLSPTYLRAARCWHRKYVVPTIGGVLAGAWAPEHTRKVLAAGREAGLADSSVNRLRRDLLSLVSVGRRLGYVGTSQDPLGDVRAPVQSSGPQLDNLPARTDIQKLSAAIVETTGQWWRGLEIDLLALTGLRIGELLGLTHDDVDLGRRELRIDRQLLAISGPITAAPPKYDSRRRVPLGGHLIPGLAQLLAEHAGLEPQPWEGSGKTQPGAGIPLFPSAQGGFERYSTFKNQRWAPACYAAGWQRDPSGRGFVWTPHTLRHYYCTIALAPPPDGLGLEVADVSRIAGHASPRMTWDVYVQSRPGRTGRGADALEAYSWVQ